MLLSAVSVNQFVSFYYNSQNDSIQELEAGDIDSNEHSEAWLIARIWTMIDKAFGDIDMLNVNR